MAAYISDSKNILQKNMKKILLLKNIRGLNLVEKLCVRRTVPQVIPSYQKLGEVPVLFYQIKITIMALLCMYPWLAYAFFGAYFVFLICYLWSMLKTNSQTH